MNESQKGNANQQVGVKGSGPQSESEQSDPVFSP